MAPVASSAARDEVSGAAAGAEEDASQKIQDEEMSVRRVQEWWCDGSGPAAVARNPILAAIDTSILADLISAGGAYHTILPADRLDGIHSRLGGSTEAALEPLRKALQTKGGAKAQARVLGMLLFKEARTLHLQCEEEGFVPAEVASAPSGGATTAALESVRLDESWSTPRLYVRSEFYPEGAQMAIRASASSKSSQVATLPANTEYYATGIAGDFLQVQLQIDGAVATAYALRKMGDTVLLVPAPTAAPQSSPIKQAGATATPAPQVSLEEAWSPPRRFICSESYPEGAQMAIRSGPSRESKQVATVGPGTEYMASGRCGDYLQIKLEIDGVLTTAYVTHTINDMILLVPAEAEALAGRPAPAARAAAAAVVAAEAATAAAAAEAATGSRVVALEAKVMAQDRVIQALQAEMAQMRTQLSTVATAFRPLTTAS